MAKTLWRIDMKINRSHNGMILGVCKGLEESLGIQAKYFRIILILCALFFRAWFILALYLAAALLMPTPRSEGWNFQHNFENLRKDARQKAREEYREFVQTLRSRTPSRENDESGTSGNESRNPGP